MYLRVVETNFFEQIIREILSFKKKVALKPGR